MITKTVRYKNFEDQEMVEELHFHLSAAELLEMQLDTTTVVGSMIGKLRERATEAEEQGIPVEKLAEDFPTNDIPKLFQVIKAFVLNGYGQREDGKFKKSTELREEFAASEAYSALILELCSDAEKGAAFINGMVPANLSEQVAKLAGTQAPTEPRPLAVVPDARKVTRKEMAEMSGEEFAEFRTQLAEGKAEIVEDTAPVSS